MKKKYSILITGAAGFIGSNFLDVINKTDYKNIIIIDKLSYSGNIKNIKNSIQSKKILFFKRDILNKDIFKLFKKFNILHVVNFAAESHVDNSIDSPEIFFKSNVMGTLNLLNQYKKYYFVNMDNKEKKISKFLHISTDEVYGSLKTKEKPFTENSKFKPNNPYSASKAASDHLCRSYFKTFKLPILITHCSNNYGPKQHNEKLIPKVIECILKKKPIPVYGSGKNVRDWIYVADHCRALKLVLNKGRPGETYDIGTNNEISNNTLVKMICKIMQKKIPSKLVYKKLINYVPDRKGHDFRYSINSEKIKKTLNFKTLTSFEIGLEKTISWYINNFE